MCESMNRCVICDQPITDENDSLEHVILQSIGGRWELPGELCCKCNNQAGYTWDAELASQLQPLSLFFRIKRQKGETPPLAIKTTTGEQLFLRADGSLAALKPEFSKENIPEGFKVRIAARSDEEAREMLAGLKKKYPSI